MVRPFPVHVYDHFESITPLAAVGVFASILALVALCAKRATKSPKGTLYADNDDDILYTGVKTTNKVQPKSSPMSTPKRLLSNLSNIKTTTKKKNNNEEISKEDEELTMVNEVKDSFGEGGLWQKNILMGEKCQPLEYSGVIYYDNNGNRISEIPRSPRYSFVSQQQGNFSFPISSPSIVE